MRVIIIVCLQMHAHTHTCYKRCVFAHHFLLTIQRKRLYKATALKMASGIVPIVSFSQNWDAHYVTQKLNLEVFSLDFLQNLDLQDIIFCKTNNGTLPPSLQYRSVKAYSKHMPFLHKAMQALQDQIRSNPVCTNPITSNTCLARDNLFSIALKPHHNLALVAF